jgi:transcriptional regulator with XRE-family HTH domain
LLDTTADKLRYYRNMKGLLQREIADHAGIDRSTYIKYESRAHGLYDFDVLAKIAPVCLCAGGEFEAPTQAA